MVGKLRKGKGWIIIAVDLGRGYDQTPSTAAKPGRFNELLEAKCKSMD